VLEIRRCQSCSELSEKYGVVLMIVRASPLEVVAGVRCEWIVDCSIRRDLCDVVLVSVLTPVLVIEVH
jgi:hypothetical protein